MSSHLKKPATFTSLLIGLVASACSQPISIEHSIQAAASILDKTSSTDSVNYTLTHEADFPCQLTLQEGWRDGDTEWHQLYRFDLTDIEQNTFIQSKSGRRAIIYSGYRITDGQDKRVFSEIRINNLRFRGKMEADDQRQLIDAWNQAISLCEEQYLLD